MPNDRSSEADEPILVHDAQEIARIEAENTLRQFDAAMEELKLWIANQNYKLRPSTIMRLNGIALERLSKYAGVTRPGNIKITGSTHVPVDAKEVPRFLEEFCDYINDNWHDKNAMHLSAYSLWKINWIHPFVDGNGRTSRILSYLIICAKLGYRLPGVKTVPDQIASNKQPYYKALESADVAFSAGQIDVGELEKLVDAHLAVQLLDIHKRAASGNGDDRAAVAEVPEYGPPKGLKNKKNNFNIVSHIEKHPVVYTFVGGFVLLAISTLLT